MALLNALLNAPGVALPELGLEGDRPSAAAVLAAPAVRAAHDRAAGAAGSAEAGRRQGRHFVALVKVAKDYLWLDGKRAGPSAPAREAKGREAGAAEVGRCRARRAARRAVFRCGAGRHRAAARAATAGGLGPRPRTSARRGAAAPVPPPAPLARLSLRRTRSGDSQDAPALNDRCVAPTESNRTFTLRAQRRGRGRARRRRSSSAATASRLFTNVQPLFAAHTLAVRHAVAEAARSPYFDVAAAQRLLHGEREPRLGRRRRRRDREELVEAP